MRIPRQVFFMIGLVFVIPIGAAEICGSLSGTLTLAESPYTATCDISVGSGDTLTIEPGVEIRFYAGTALQVDGTLTAWGSSSAPIVFTSAEASPAAGDWDKILVNGSATIHEAVFRYAGIGIRDSGSAYLDVADSSFRFNHFGIHTWYSNGTQCHSVSECEFSDNDQAGMLINYTKSNFVVSDCSFQRNGVPIHMDYESCPTLSGLTVGESNQYCNCVQTGTNYTDSITLTSAGIPYTITGTSPPYLWVFNDYTTLTLEKGVVIKAHGPSFNIHAYNVVIKGTESEPVVITSFKDDSIGGDTNVDGPSSGSPGESNTLYINGLADIHHGYFRYSNLSLYGVGTAPFHVADTTFESNVDAFFFSGTCVTSPEGNCFFDRLTFRNNTRGLIFMGNTSTVVSDSDFFGNGKAVFIDISANPALGNLNDSSNENDGGNQFICNTIAVDNDNTATIFAENNWWNGAPPDPSLFQGAIDYSPYLMEETGDRPAISSLTLAIGGSQDILIEWDDLGLACGYRVLKSGEPNTGFTDISGPLEASEFTDPAAAAQEGILFYKVDIQ